MKNQFTGTTRVWLSRPGHYGAADLAADVAAGLEGFDMVHLARHDMSNYGWLEVGVASVEVTLHPPEEMTHRQMAALQAELQAHRAEAQVRENEILNRISKLQALTMEVVA